MTDTNPDTNPGTDMIEDTLLTLADHLWATVEAELGDDVPDTVTQSLHDLMERVQDLVETWVSDTLDQPTN